MGWRAVVGSVALAMSCVASASLPETPHFQRLGIEQGLPSSTATSVLQDRRGFLWVGTEDGLARFDGGSFRSYRPAPAHAGSLPGNEVTALHLDDVGRLWVAVSGYGVSRLDPESTQFVEIEPPSRMHEPWDVSAIRSTPDGSTWFGTRQHGVMRVRDDGRWQQLTFDDTGASIPQVLALEVDGGGRLWIGTDYGLYRFDGARPVRESIGGLPSLRVGMLSSDEEGLWIGTDAGLWAMPFNGAAAMPEWAADIGGGPVQATLLDRDGTRWIVTRDGLATIRHGALHKVDTGDRGSFRSGAGLFEDAEGGLWVLKPDAGLLRLSPHWRQFAVFPQSRIGAIAASRRGGAWVAGGDGLTYVDLETGRRQTMVPAAAFAACDVRALAEGEGKALWLGCEDALLRIDVGSRSVARWDPHSRSDAVPVGDVSGIFVVEGLAWIQAGRELQARDTLGRVLRTIRLDNLGGGRPSDSKLAIGPDGFPWVSGSAGLHAWSERTGEWLRVPGSPLGRIDEIAFQGRETAWIHRGGWLEEYRWDGARLILVKRDVLETELPSTSNGMSVDGSGKVWFATPRGLLRYDPANQRAWIFGAADGVLSSEFETKPLLTGTETFLTHNAAALVAFEPEEFGEGAGKSLVDLDSVSVRRSDAIEGLSRVAQTMALLPDDRDLRIVAHLRSLTDPKGHRFRFRLGGRDVDWVEVADGVLVIPRLAHGKHVIEVEAAKRNGDWSAPRRVDILVLPKWWQAKHAPELFAVLTFLLMSALAMTFRARLRSVHAAKLREQAREIAERNSDAKTRFLADFGHEIRTPMTGMLGMAELLHSDSMEPRQRRRVEAIQAAGQHLLRLVNDALDLARIEAGKMSLYDAVFELRAVIAEVEALLRPLAEAKGLDLRVIIAVNSPRALRGDAGRVRQVLLNLGQNAVKFTAAGHVALHVLPLADGEGVRFEVADTGSGLDAAQRARLFQRFEQADGAGTWARHGGSGLGLAICQEIALAMGGRIEVGSEPGRGTTFELTLPLPHAAIPPRKPERHIRETRPSVRVLLVEDDALVAEVLRGLLELQGHQVVHAAQGLAALAEAATSKFDLVLLDLDLPGLDGLEVGRLLREQAPKLPLVALTARADGEAEAQALSAGLSGFVRKPVTGEDLAVLIARFVHRATAEEMDAA
jgi:signal transduction histidine kinase/ActR/RegA family two-component response regulator/sugar lactone lactonase YvrE